MPRIEGLTNRINENIFRVLKIGVRGIFHSGIKSCLERTTANRYENKFAKKVRTVFINEVTHKKHSDRLILIMKIYWNYM